MCGNEGPNPRSQGSQTLQIWRSGGPLEVGYSAPKAGTTGGSPGLRCACALVNCPFRTPLEHEGIQALRSSEPILGS